MNLARSVHLTGDDGDFYTEKREGMHTMMFGGVLQLDHVRTDNCGQRYTLGRYCIHMHLIGHCADCRIASNAVVEGEAKGITIHGTHDALVDNNVLYVSTTQAYRRPSFTFVLCSAHTPPAILHAPTGGRRQPPSWAGPFSCPNMDKGRMARSDA